eukprot:GHVN01060301.1.p1 GENE.GHVN01060301.1~~GHVN01060301.1.p1  ORF type:complete len:740 (-),score=92.39 GHVN01060301.1:5073-7292(-)
MRSAAEWGVFEPELSHNGSHMEGLSFLRDLPVHADPQIVFHRLSLDPGEMFGRAGTSTNNAQLCDLTLPVSPNPLEQDSMGVVRDIQQRSPDSSAPTSDIFSPNPHFWDSCQLAPDVDVESHLKVARRLLARPHNEEMVKKLLTLLNSECDQSCDDRPNSLPHEFGLFDTLTPSPARSGRLPQSGQSFLHDDHLDMQSHTPYSAHPMTQLHELNLPFDSSLNTTLSPKSESTRWGDVTHHLHSASAVRGLHPLTDVGTSTGSQHFQPPNDGFSLADPSRLQVDLVKSKYNDYQNNGGVNIISDTGTNDFNKNGLLQCLDVKLFVGRVPRTYNEESLRKVFAKFGPVLDVFIMKYQDTGNHKRSGFVRMARREDADRAIEELHNRSVLDPHQGAVQVRYASGERERLQMALKPTGASRGEGLCKLFVRNLPREVTESELRAIFELFGEVKEILIMTDSQGLSEGYAFVKYASDESAHFAIRHLNQRAPSILGSRSVARPPHWLSDGCEENEINFQVSEVSEVTQDCCPQKECEGASPTNGCSHTWCQLTAEFGKASIPEAFSPISFPSLFYPPGEERRIAVVGSHRLPQLTDRRAGSYREILSVNGKCQYLNFDSGEWRFDPPPEFLEMHGPLPASGVGPSGANIFIFHIPNEWDSNDLAQTFALFGRIISARIATSKQGRPLGYGFVSYESKCHARQATAQLNGFHTFNKRLKVQVKTGQVENEVANQNLRVPPPCAYR